MRVGGQEMKYKQKQWWGLFTFHMRNTMTLKKEVKLVQEILVHNVFII